MRAIVNGVEPERQGTRFDSSTTTTLTTEIRKSSGLLSEPILHPSSINQSLIKFQIISTLETVPRVHNGARLSLISSFLEFSLYVPFTCLRQSDRKFRACAILP